MTPTAPTLDKIYEPKTVEDRLYRYWEEQKLFKPESQPVTDGEPFCIVIPPPNVTGVLHMGHALDGTIQDILIRWRRMRGDKTLWMPGTDHAGIATQSVVERNLAADGKTRHDLGRAAFLETVWDWALARKSDIIGQFKRLGVSPDWERERFTLDAGCSRAVRQAFSTLYDRGLIYQGEYIVNWDPVAQSAISDIETEYTEEESFLWEIAYPLAEGDEQLVVATTRPETMYGDVAVAVHPEDERYKHLIGQQVRLPLTNKTIPVIGDAYVEREFGTGALKVTPAHDPNDFKLGMTHKLDPVIVMDERGHIKPLEFIPTEVQGLERFEARKVTEQLLEAQGVLIKKTPHTHRVGRAQRSGAVIEPLMSKQWFVKTRPLADQCLASLDAGKIRFVPERWTKDYVRWLTDIQDWCISRQLWWGHQIPAWHCDDCGEITVAVEDPTQCAHCASGNIRQDEDVLDTWFSSGLWPFSTMGWPDESAGDFRQFYPTSVLVTGFDIIFFWVARMTMFGESLTGQSPFHTVYIHGLIRDEKGQKMSKSKGNTVDPVGMIDEIGCDAFRFALTSLITYGGQDIKLAKDKFELGRVFTNKLWNASRFVLMNLEGVDDQPIDAALLSTMDRWMLSRYHAAVQQANTLLGEFKLGELVDVLYEFTWNAFCDWYVEYAKKQLKDDPAMAANTRRILLSVLSGMLRLWHPVMPFITEALYQQLPHQPTESIVIAPYPKADATLIDETVNDTTDFVLAVVRAIRNLRQQYGVPHPQPVAVTVETVDAGERTALETNRDLIAHFVRLSELTVVDKLETMPEDVGLNVLGRARILMSLAGLIDKDAERERLTKKRDELTAEKAKIDGMLNNPGFVAKAPEAVVAKNRDRLAEIDQQLSALTDQLTGLG
ncbi:MAG: valine--tRNA ligase [Candidatus Melainabacteria bacterium]